MSDIAELRRMMGAEILGYEARRDKAGHLAVYRLAASDGGGRYEVAGINDRYHPGKAAALKALVEAKRYDQAEKEAVEYYLGYTGCVLGWLDGVRPKSEFILRDCALNAGSGGACRIMQMAVGAGVDGKYGPRTRSKVEYVLGRQGDEGLMDLLSKARWEYMEGKTVQHPSKKVYWKGWVNRMNKARAFAEKL